MPFAEAWRIAIGAETVGAAVTAREFARQRGNHAGTQLAATISDFGPAVAALSVSLTGNQTKSGVLTFASVPKSTGTTAYGDSTEILSRGLLETWLISPQLLMERDNFLTAKKWYEMMSGTGTVDAGYAAAGGLGGFVLNTGTTSGSNAGLALAVNGNFSPLNFKPWEMRFRVKTGPTIANCKYRVGFSGNGNTFNPDLWSVGGMGFDYSPALSPNWRFANDPSGGMPAYTNTGIAVATNTIYDFRIRSTATDNQCYVSVNGGAETLITGARDYLVGPALGVQNTTAASRVLIPLFFGIKGLTS